MLEDLEKEEEDAGKEAEEPEFDGLLQIVTQRLEQVELPRPDVPEEAVRPGGAHVEGGAVHQEGANAIARSIVETQPLESLVQGGERRHEVAVPDPEPGERTGEILDRRPRGVRRIGELLEVPVHDAQWVAHVVEAPGFSFHAIGHPHPERREGRGGPVVEDDLDLDGERPFARAHRALDLHPGGGHTGRLDRAAGLGDPAGARLASVPDTGEGERAVDGERKLRILAPSVGLPAASALAPDLAERPDPPGRDLGRRGVVVQSERPQAPVSRVELAGESVPHEPHGPLGPGRHWRRRGRSVGGWSRGVGQGRRCFRSTRWCRVHGGDRGLGSRRGPGPPAGAQAAR